MIDGYIGFPTFGLFGLLIAFMGVAAAVICLVLSLALARRSDSASETLGQCGQVATVLACVALTFCCGVLVYCFMIGDISITYVVEYQSDATGSLAWLYRLSGLWGGREGSLLFWAWIISVFNTVVALRARRQRGQIDFAALLVADIVLLAFVGLLLFSEDNIPFVAIDESYVDEDGALTGAALYWGMSSLLEHWAMAIHPPTLFIGYAGLTIPFAYAMAALIVGDASDLWVRRAQGYALLTWLFLTVGIGLGAIWAYVVLGWGGYWGWDPVENASLLPWLTSVALIHSFTVYRQRGMFKRWSVFCAALSFSFVVLGTFITRSGIIESVHAFSGDTVSLVLFLVLIVCSLVAAVIGLALRWKAFAAPATDELDALPGKYIAAYVNNLVVVLCAVLLAYLTLASALPEPLPLAGLSVSTATYEAIARPLGIVYLLLVAVCPLLSWAKTDRRAFARRALVPGICALVLFAALLVVFALYLKPIYDAIIAEGGTAADELLEYGPSAYYFGLTIAGFAVASLLVMNALFTAGRVLRSGGLKGLRRRLPALGGSVAHAAMAVLLVGLIGSSMYVSDETFYLTYDEEEDTIEDVIEMNGYTLEYAESAGVLLDNEDDIVYEICFNVYKGDTFVKHISPSLTYTQSTVSTTTNAAVASVPYEDVFVIFQGFSDEYEVAIEVIINPFISFVWAGIVLLALGMLLSLLAARQVKAPSAVEAAALERATAAETRATSAEEALAAAEARIQEAEARAAAAEARAAALAAGEGVEQELAQANSEGTSDADGVGSDDASAPEAADSADAPEAPDVADAPEAGDTDEARSAEADAPEAPEVPEVPDAPETDEAAGAPAASDAGAADVLEAGDADEARSAGAAALDAADAPAPEDGEA